MVHKTSHRGVHSGNTLRAFNSRYSRRYHNQSCIVSRVRPELLQKLAAASKADDTTPQLQNVAVDVALSLNKQARWLLPSALIRQIKNNDIAQPGLTVSVLERHKLKRPACCVSFHSNKGEVKRIQPKNGRYFGFTFPTAEGKSRRMLRRERREELQGKNKVKGDKVMGRVVEVYTEQGRARINSDIGETEVRYEVYYPSSAKSSISHNPKYIKQDIDAAPGFSNDYVLQGKPRKQHCGKQRKRLPLKYVDECDLPSYRPDFDQPLATLTHTTDHDESSSLDNVKEEETTDVKDEQTTTGIQEEQPATGVKEQTTTDCLLSSLIEKAQQLQNFRVMNKPRRKKKADKTCSHHEDDKSHIVYIEGKQEPSSQERKSEEPTPSSHQVTPIPSESTRVLLPKDDVTTTSLKDCFGERYFEAGCKPRRFLLDVTPNVREVLKKEGIQAKVAEHTSDALSYLICVHDGFYDDDYDVYKVLLNSKLHQGLLAVRVNTEEHQDLYRGTVMNLISQTMDFVQGMVTVLKDKNYFPAVHAKATICAPGRCLNNVLASSDTYIPSVQRMFQRGSAISDVSMPTLADMLEEDPVFCDVCYDDISPLTADSAASTCLLKCQHHVCDACWSQHIHTRLHEGFVRLTCPGYDCQEKVHVGVLLSVAALDTVDKLLQRQEEVRIGASPTEKWCPNESCGRVISLCTSPSNGELQCQQDVVCECGTHVCFQCLMPAHWPASCKQAEDYRLNLTTTTFPDRLAEVHDDYRIDQEAKNRREQQKGPMLVEGKHCPTCKSFVFKNGGCPQMVCRCGQPFCWYCTRPGPSHPNRVGCVNDIDEKKLTTTVVVRHLDTAKSQENTQKEQQQTGTVGRRQRMSLMEKAAEHLQHRQKNNVYQHAVTALAKSVAKAAAKNTVLTQHIVRACSEPFLMSSKSSKSRRDSSEPASSTSVSVLEMVTAFLKKAAHTKQELHKVVEYSLVLLKDLPDSLHRRRALRISEDLGAFCSFSQSIFDVWSRSPSSPQSHLQEAVKAVMRLAEIQGWIQAALDTHVVTIRKLRSLRFPDQ